MGQQPSRPSRTSIVGNLQNIPSPYNRFNKAILKALSIRGSVDTGPNARDIRKPIAIYKPHNIQWGAEQFLRGAGYVYLNTVRTTTKGQPITLYYYTFIRGSISEQPEGVYMCQIVRSAPLTLRPGQIIRAPCARTSVNPERAQGFRGSFKISQVLLN